MNQPPRSLVFACLLIAMLPFFEFVGLPGVIYYSAWEAGGMLRLHTALSVLAVVWLVLAPGYLIDHARAEQRFYQGLGLILLSSLVLLVWGVMRFNPLIAITVQDQLEFFWRSLGLNGRISLMALLWALWLVGWRMVGRSE